MFTVCPKCALTLVVTATDLRIAQGYVRCGRCLNVFNALARLSEERPAAPPEPSPETEAAGSGEQTASAAPAQAPSPSPEPPQEPPQEPASTIDDTGEIEIEIDPSILVTSVRPPAAFRSAAVPQPEAHEPSAAAPIPRASAPATASALAPEAIAVAVTPTQTPPATSAPPPETAEPASPAEVPDTLQTNTPQERPDSVFELTARRPAAGLAWKLGAGALMIALALQIVNHYRDALAANPALSAVYSALGVKLAPRWNIHAYDVRQLGASVAGAVAGEIVVRASVKNSASRAQPLPLLRVTLQDRFGNRIAARDVPPNDYLPSSVAPKSLLAAGSRVDATMVFVDPGPQAVGFEIDACLQQRSGEVACAHGP